MVLTTSYPSYNQKTGKMAVTTRSGELNEFGSCPNTCALNPYPVRSGTEIDHEYLRALRKAVPKDGQAFTYTHSKKYIDNCRPPKAGETCINISCDTPKQAVRAVKKGHPAVIVVPPGEGNKPLPDGTRVILCHNTAAKDRLKDGTLNHLSKSSIQCNGCGGKKGPMCAWADRDFVISFEVHGSPNMKKAAGNTEKQGGCYASEHLMRLKWRRVAGTDQGEKTDSEVIKEFIPTLPNGTNLRHHDAGDICKLVNDDYMVDPKTRRECGTFKCRTAQSIWQNAMEYAPRRVNLPEETVRIAAEE